MAKLKMSAPTASQLAWSTWVLSLALTALSLFLLLLTRSDADVPTYAGWLEETLTAMGYSTVGAIVFSRRPENIIGWLFCIIGFFVAVDHFCGEYGIYTLLASPGVLPAGKALVWVSFWILVPALGLCSFLFLLFPDGRLPSSGWRWFAWLCALLTTMGAVLSAFSPGSPSTAILLQNPLGVAILPSREVVGRLVEALLFTLVLIAAASMFVRLRRTRGVEGQQIKGVAYAAAATASGAILTYSVARALSIEWLEWIGYALTMAGVLGIPISMGIAILRYHLYNIDLVINRTLVYGVLTVSLVVVYVGGVLSLQYLFRVLTGEESNLAIVASTLAIAALFNPLRRRIQSFVDRRFYRRKYDAAKTLEAFGTKLRAETDLERLCEDLTAVVHETLQPAHVSLWLRPTPPPGSGENPGEPAVGKAEAQ